MALFSSPPPLSHLQWHWYHWCRFLSLVMDRPTLLLQYDTIVHFTLSVLWLFFVFRFHSLSLFGFVAKHICERRPENRSFEMSFSRKLRDNCHDFVIYAKLWGFCGNLFFFYYFHACISSFYGGFRMTTYFRCFSPPMLRAI